MVLNSINFCLSVKVLISPLNLNEILAGWSNLGCRFFPFITLYMSCHSLLACRVSAERTAVNLMGIPLCVICCFSLAVFNIFSLYLISDSLINMYLGMFLLGYFLYVTLCFLDLIDYFLSHIREVFNIISSNIFSVPFFFSSSSGTTIMWMLVCLILSQRSLRLS